MNPMYHYWWDTMHGTIEASKLAAGASIEAYSSVLNPDFEKWYDVFMNCFLLDPDFLKDYFMNGWYIPSTAEAARRYYSAKQFHTLGTPNVAFGITPWSIFGKFFDLSDQSNLLPRPDNKHFIYNSLKKTLEEFAHLPIKTDKSQPRFLLVAVDVQTGDAVTFDSYEKPATYSDVEALKNKNESNDERKHYSEYGNEQSKHVILYDKGVGIEHILASGTFPNFFDYPKFKVEEDSEAIFSKRQHNFWDGGFRSNTPLREVIQAHRDYWHKIDTNEEDDVPDLEVYIADLWPSELKEAPISFDNDFVENRKLNLIFSDKTHYDEQVAEVVTDYIDLAKKLKNLAERSGASKDEIDHTLAERTHSKNRKGQTRMYKSLLEGRFRVSKVVRIDHRDDGNEVANKIYDYSSKTIESLMKDGYCDALYEMGIQSIKDAIIKMNYKNGTGIDDNHIQELEQRLQQIQKSTKMENGYDAIINHVDGFIIQVQSINEFDNQSIKEEKGLLVNSAKKFKEIIKRTKNLGLMPQIL
jgi:predicted acylesterase/phospholipase RssA